MLFSVVPVWGKSYIERFVARGLPSLMARGNLPSIERHGCDWRLVLCTRERDFTRISRTIAATGLVQAERIELLPIDGVLTGVPYALALSAVYVKALKTLGARDNVFHFSNADFIIGDGTLSAAFSRIEEGFRGVFAPSLRCNDSSAIDDACLLWSTAEGGFSNRALAAFALADLHPTVIAACINNHANVSRSGAHQLFWNAEQRALFGRWYLQFIFMVRPEVEIDKLECFCDYSLFPQLVPSTSFYSPSFSDEMFILEPTPPRHEMRSIRLIEPNARQHGRDLRRWATQVHRDLGSRPYTVRTEDELDLDEARRRFDAYAAEVDDIVNARPPLPSANHPFWVLAMGDSVAWLDADAEARSYLRVGRPSAAQRFLRWFVPRALSRRLAPLADAAIETAGTEGVVLTNLRLVRDSISRRIGDDRSRMAESFGLDARDVVLAGTATPDFIKYITALGRLRTTRLSVVLSLPSLSDDATFDVIAYAERNPGSASLTQYDGGWLNTLEQGFRLTIAARTFVGRFAAVGAVFVALVVAFVTRVNRAALRVFSLDRLPRDAGMLFRAADISRADFERLFFEPLTKSILDPRGPQPESVIDDVDDDALS